MMIRGGAREGDGLFDLTFLITASGLSGRSAQLGGRWLVIEILLQQRRCPGEVDVDGMVVITSRDGWVVAERPVDPK